jgi:branched-chain amino acid transport system permease protein
MSSNNFFNKVRLLKLKDNKLIIIIIIAAIYFVTIPLFFRNSSYLLSVIIYSSILSCASLGVWLTFSIGRINIGQAAFVGIGGYATAILMTKLDISFWISLPLSGIIAAFFSLLLGFVLLRLKGIYFSMITLTLTNLTNLVFLNAVFITRGANGIMNIPRPGAVNIGNFTIIPSFRTDNYYILFYYLVSIILIVCFICVWRLYNSRIGWIFRALRQSETLTQSIGINIIKYRIMAYTICGFLGGISGSLFVVYIQNIFPESFKVADSINYMLYCFLGGLDYIFGPILGSFLLTIFFEMLRGIQKYQQVIYSIILICIMLWIPNGIFSIKLSKNKEQIKNLR